ncbi:hypothetical protein [Actinomycetospora aurantiaca]|uniref:hypothetical protein n=1 Tax=Actinomycetospora aurantiaca TaxID=3129233 RepID=UPI00359FB7E4
MRAALDLLHPQRIGHGIRRAEDPTLSERLAESGVVLEVALTSNVHTRAVPALHEHPLPESLRAGTEVALCTDDQPQVAGQRATQGRRGSASPRQSSSGLRRETTQRASLVADAAADRPRRCNRTGLPHRGSTRQRPPRRTADPSAALLPIAVSWVKPPPSRCPQPVRVDCPPYARSSRRDLSAWNL